MVNWNDPQRHLNLAVERRNHISRSRMLHTFLNVRENVEIENHQAVSMLALSTRRLDDVLRHHVANTVVAGCILIRPLPLVIPIRLLVVVLSTVHVAHQVEMDYSLRALDNDHIVVREAHLVVDHFILALILRQKFVGNDEVFREIVVDHIAADFILFDNFFVAIVHAVDDMLTKMIV